MLGIDVIVEPLTDLLLPLKVCTPVFVVNVVALFVILPAILYAEIAVSFQTEPAFKVMSPVKVFVPVLPSVYVPVIFVVPVTPKVYVDAGLNVVPVPMSKFPPIVMLAADVAETVPVKVRFPTILVVPD